MNPNQHQEWLRSGAAPRSVLRGAVFATAPGDRRGAGVAIEELRQDLNDGLGSVVDFKAKTDTRLQEVERALEGLAISAAARKAGAGQTGPAVDPEYTRAFSGFIRSGDREADVKAANRVGRFAEIQASMSVGTNSAGGYLAPAEWDRTINAALLPLTPMRRLATVFQSGVNAYSKVWNSRGWGSGWVGETAVRTETSAASLASVMFPVGTVYANPSVTQDLLDDAQIDVAGFLASELEGEFSRQEDIAFIAGNGTNKPNGFLTYATGGVNAATHPGGALDTVTVAGTTAVTADELVDFFYGLSSPYRQNASWLMSSTTAAKIAKLKDGQGNYLWRESFLAGQPQTLLGKPVEFDENMPTMATGALPIALGDFKRGYLINDRAGVRILRDPYTAKPYVLFYATKRVGAGVQDPRAIRVVKMA